MALDPIILRQAAVANTNPVGGFTSFNLTQAGTLVAIRMVLRAGHFYSVSTDDLSAPMVLLGPGGLPINPIGIVAAFSFTAPATGIYLLAFTADARHVISGQPVNIDIREFPSGPPTTIGQAADPFSIAGNLPGLLDGILSGGTQFYLHSAAQTTAILWQNDNGSLAVWNVDGTTVAGAALVGSNPGPTWHVEGTANLNNDGKSDIVWQNENGSVAAWMMDGSMVTSAAPIGGNADPSWHVKGTGDFNGDGASDILWQNDNGAVAVWLMNGTTVTSAALVGSNPGPTWHVRGIGDLNGDGLSDILWQNDNGAVGAWAVNGFSVTDAALVGANPGPTWHVKGSGDFNGDGLSDVLWQNDSGSVAIWTLEGATVTEAALLGSNPGPSWHVKSAEDIDADGKTDILWQNDNGSVAVWNIDGTTVTGAALIGSNPGPSWQTIGSDGMHFINGTSGTAPLIATVESDEFILTSFSQGAHVISGFNATQDSIELSKSLFPDFPTLQAHSTPSGSSTVITLGSTSSLTILGLPVTLLHASDFVFA